MATYHGGIPSRNTPDLTSLDWRIGLAAAGVRPCAIREIEAAGVMTASDLIDVPLWRLQHVGPRTLDTIFTYLWAQ